MTRSADPVPLQAASELLDILCEPGTLGPLELVGRELVTPQGKRFSISPNGIPCFTETHASPEALRQQEHYDRVSEAYLANLEYPHSIEIAKRIDAALLASVEQPIETLVELCCGRGEALRLPLTFGRWIGVDVSLSMLEAGLRARPRQASWFIQGDATALPLRSGCCDAVFMLGGIHHVNDRARLYSEVARILRPGGRLYWREPVNDFLPWRLARALIYRVSPALDAETERPLRRGEEAPILASAGLQLERWQTIGFAAWALFMNSDVLVVNRALRFVPGIGRWVKAGALLDEAILRLPGARGWGAQVIGVARKPAV